MRFRIVALFALLLLLTGCGVREVVTTSLPTAPVAPVFTPTPVTSSAPPTVPSAPVVEPAATSTTINLPTVIASPPDLSTLQLTVEPVLNGFRNPTHITNAGDGTGRLFVVEQAGAIWIVQDGVRLEEPLLDLTELVGSQGSEQGLLSVAFHPQFRENGFLFVNYTDRNGTTVVARYTLSADPNRADPASATILMTIDQPAANHNGGLLKFGPDGYLYIGTGDGGASGDPWNNAQTLSTLLGKLLRIDVDSNEPYAVPANNPFIDADPARSEIWAYGLRNPWRFSFDRATGDLYLADVGQNALEEVHVQPASSLGGENYGWKIMEGDRCFNASSCDQTGLELPVFVYPHGSAEGGCSITGGYVYRGRAFPQLNGVYVFTDFCTGNLWGTYGDGVGWETALLGRVDLRITSFGEDEAGELYLVDRAGGGVYRLVVE
ncbi:PQQ-dependent sugar dehydrogenase [Candidatus Chloroploca sp. M-50]|uniref:PQQ-dependent sugar dehydrogenase n=1 Tax=Candidatus Chloroploca mongolica TaxID=2528176 RepID=A0ABS4D748_9CHLR|nr:PQQ-dependent sugar dehydrogenase [Candidatus Chloroploca mongolica]MBP1465262.1 PQQ-dependent sugar dehydrogenase [Candidatus Chloroploca mongolica]